MSIIRFNDEDEMKNFMGILDSFMVRNWEVTEDDIPQGRPSKVNFW